MMKRDRSVKGSVLVSIELLLTVTLVVVYGILWRPERTYQLISFVPACLCIPLSLAIIIFPLQASLYKLNGFLLGLLAINEAVIDAYHTHIYGIEVLLVVAFLYDIYTIFMAIVYMSATNEMLTKLQVFPLSGQANAHPVHQNDMGMYHPPPPIMTPPPPQMYSQPPPPPPQMYSQPPFSYPSPSMPPVYKN